MKKLQQRAGNNPETDRSRFTAEYQTSTNQPF